MMASSCSPLTFAPGISFRTFEELFAWIENIKDKLGELYRVFIVATHKDRRHPNDPK
jgi:hypothetical protein